MPWTETIDPSDDTFHKRNDNPYWNEASFCTYYVPERKLSGVVYFHFRPNMKMANWGPMIWDPSGDDNATCLHYALDDYMAMPDGCDMFDFDLPNGLSVRPIELQKSYRYTYEGIGCWFDLTWTAVMDPYYMRERHINASNMIDWAQMLGEGIDIGHYEQSGRMKGTLHVGGEDIEVDSVSLRDHSWGPREVRSNMKRGRGSYPFAMADDGNSFNFYAKTPLEVEDDPVIGTTEQLSSGYWVKDGVLGELESGECRTERDETGAPKVITVDATDNLGRRLEAEGEFVNRMRWYGGLGDYLVNWCQASFSFDGNTNVTGDNWDYFLYQHTRQFHRARAEAGATA